jgi:hypothetical protein
MPSYSKDESTIGQNSSKKETRMIIISDDLGLNFLILTIEVFLKSVFAKKEN